MPQTFEDVVELLVPELQRRGIFWEDYTVPGGTYRENFLGLPGQNEPLPSHPAGKMIWRPEGETKKSKTVGFKLDGVHGSEEDAQGRMDFQGELKKKEELIDPAAMQLC
jgi:hypothetical protein